MTMKKILRTGLAALVFTLPIAGCEQKVSIQRLDDIKAEVEVEVNEGYVEGIVTGMNYTQDCEGNNNRLSFIVRDESDKYTQCYTQDRSGSNNEDTNYNLAGSLIDSAKQEKSRIKVYGKKTEQYFEVREIETQGYRINFEQGEK